MASVEALLVIAEGVAEVPWEDCGPEHYDALGAIQGTLEDVLDRISLVRDDLLRQIVETSVAAPAVRHLRSVKA